MERIRYLRGQISQRDKLVREMYQKNYHNISDMENQIKEYDQAIAKVYEMVPNMKDTPGLLVDFSHLLTENHLTSETINFGQLKAQQTYSTFTLGLKVKGLAPDVQNFLKAVEKYKRAVTINKLDFTPTEDGLLEANIELTVYVMNDVLPDPLDYPFTGEEQGNKNPFDMFKYYENKSGGGGGQAVPLNPADFFNQLFKMNPGGGGLPQIPSLPSNITTPSQKPDSARSPGTAPQGQSKGQAGGQGAGAPNQGKATGGESQTQQQPQPQGQQEGKTGAAPGSNTVNPAFRTAPSSKSETFTNKALDTTKTKENVY